MLPNVMIDLETLGVAPDSVILSIAAVEFNPFEISNSLSHVDSIQILLDIDDQVLNFKRTIDDSTVEWWGKQDKHVQEVIFSETGRFKVNDALQVLSKFCWNRTRIWAQGPQFDMTLLEHIYRQTNIPRPWQYWQVRDARTLMDLVQVDQPVVTHDSIEDCKRQIIGAQQALNKLGVKSFIRKG